MSLAFGVESAQSHYCLGMHDVGKFEERYNICFNQKEIDLPTLDSAIDHFKSAAEMTQTLPHFSYFHIKTLIEWGSACHRRATVSASSDAGKEKYEEDAATIFEYLEKRVRNVKDQAYRIRFLGDLGLRHPDRDKKLVFLKTSFDEACFRDFRLAIMISKNIFPILKKEDSELIRSLNDHFLNQTHNRVFSQEKARFQELFEMSLEYLNW